MNDRLASPSLKRGLSGATAAAEGIAALQKDGLAVRPLQEIHRG